MIRKVWLNAASDDYFSLCIRMSKHDEHIPQLVITKNVFPPINGRRMDIKEATRLKVAEEHVVVTGFSTEDLKKIRDAINEKIGVE